MEYITDEIKERLYGFLISFRAEIVLIGISGAILVSSVVMFTLEVKKAKAQMVGTAASFKNVDIVAQKAQEKFIYVDIAGAVEYPDVYKVSEGTRLKALVDKAGGLSTNADIVQIAQAMNMSSILSDQQKVYIPSVGDEFDVTSTGESKQADSKVSLNSATVNELNELNGVGEATAKKIIAGRPYKTLVDILSRKIVGKGVYDKIKDSITL